jgi:hypothetical protein
LIAVAVLVVGVLGFGVLNERVLKARRPVAVVDDELIRTDEYQARVRYLRASRISQYNALSEDRRRLSESDPSAEYMLDYITERQQEIQNEMAPENAMIIGEEALDDLVVMRIVRAEAEQRGIEVPASEIQQQIEQEFGYYRNPPTPMPTSEPAAEPVTDTTLLELEGVEPTPTAQMTEEEFRQTYQSYVSGALKPLGISEEMFRRWLHDQVLTDRVRQAMQEEMDLSAEQVEGQALIFEDEQLAADYAARASAGEDFEVLGEELTAGEEPLGYAAPFGWLPQDQLGAQFGTEVANLAFNAPLEEWIGPMVGQNDLLYVIQVTGRETRELSGQIATQRANQAFQSWLDAKKGQLVERYDYRERTPVTPALSSY